MGRAITTGDKWRVVVEINATSLRESFDRLEHGLWLIQVAIGKAEGLGPLLEEVGRTTQLMTEIERGLDRFEAMKPTAHDRRGLVNLGARLSSSCLEIPTPMTSKS